jgi:hypothetical protein
MRTGIILTKHDLTPGAEGCLSIHPLIGRYRSPMGILKALKNYILTRIKIKQRLPPFTVPAWAMRTG